MSTFIMYFFKKKKVPKSYQHITSASWYDIEIVSFQSTTKTPTWFKILELHNAPYFQSKRIVLMPVKHKWSLNLLVSTIYKSETGC